MGKNVAVFVDVANIFYAAKAAGTDIDYVTLLKAATAGRDFVRAYAYTGLDPDNENQRNFHAFLARNHYKVVSKDIRKYGDGKVKANLDIELVVDLMKTARNLDVAIIVSGDGDFAPAIRAVQEMGVRVEVVSFRGNTSSDLIDVADLFTDITQLARVDKTSSRSGRRVAGDDDDLSMTEVPDKLTEGSGTRSRGRGRGRGRAGEAEPVAARGRSGGRGGSRAAAAVDAEAPAATGGAPIVVLPGEKLSRVAPAAARVTALPEDEEMTPFDGELPTDDDDTDGGPTREGETEAEGEARRRRRRRGGRGRGRGRGRDGEAPVPEGMPERAARADDDEDDDEEDEEIAAAGPTLRGPRTTPFGSVWDSQIGVPAAAPAGLGPVADDEDFDEPEIPEYLIAEQRRGRQGQGGRGQGQRGGARGGRSAYTSAIERERYGRGGGGGINRYPDVSGRDRQPGRSGSGQGGGRSSGGNYARQDASYSRPQDRVERPAPRSSGDPWSEVPPELEEMLRAQLAQSPKGRRPDAGPAPATMRTEPETGGDAAGGEALTEAPAPKRRTARGRKAVESEPGGMAAADAPGGDVDVETAAPKRRTTRRKAEPGTGEAGATGADGTAEAPAPKSRTARSRKAADPAAEGGADTVGTAADETAAPKRRTTRKKAEPA